MALPNSYTLKPGSIPVYFDSIKNAEPPQRFSIKFMENLDFKSTNDRMFITILKELGFLDTDGVPTERYYRFLDKSESAKVIAEGVREAYSELFAVIKEAQKLSVDDVKNKLRTLYAGQKKDDIIGYIAKTFVALCEVADFESPVSTALPPPIKKDDDLLEEKNIKDKEVIKDKPKKKIDVNGLQYHINIVLPESKDQAVYDAIFKALKDHLE